MFLPIKEFGKTLMIWQHVGDIDEEGVCYESD